MRTRLKVFLAVGILTAAIAAPRSAAGDSFDVTLSPEDPGGVAIAPAPIPPDSVSYWLRHIVTPNDGITVRWLRQDHYADNGDGVISAGDWVTLQGIAYLVEEVGVMIQGNAYFGWYWGDYEHRQTTIEMLSPNLVPDVWGLAQMWWPYYTSFSGMWSDMNPNGELDIDDYLIGVQLYVDIEHICPKVRLQGFDAIPTVPATWGSIKGLFQ